MTTTKLFAEPSDETAVIDQAGLDPYRAFAAQALLLARNFLREQTSIDKPLPDWTVQDVVAALRKTQTRAPTHPSPWLTRQRH
jgi:hypothetical protein